MYVKKFEDVERFDYSFEFSSSNSMDHLHMLVANAQATYLGDFVPLTKALSHLQSGALVMYTCINVVYVCIRVYARFIIYIHVYIHVCI